MSNRPSASGFRNKISYAGSSLVARRFDLVSAVLIAERGTFYLESRVISPDTFSVSVYISAHHYSDSKARIFIYSHQNF
ncbi:hypothetical protein SQ11_01060 [Nitrosospira sp. NpAV]|nr:hypothetical protein SQ11_01060 [Nitrosospira sp. NpAV]